MQIYTKFYKPCRRARHAPEEVQVCSHAVGLSTDGPLPAAACNLAVEAVDGVETHVTALATADVLLVPEGQ